MEHEVTTYHAFYEYLEEELARGNILKGVYIANLNKLAEFKFNRYFNITTTSAVENDIMTMCLLKLINKRGIDNLTPVIAHIVDLIGNSVDEMELRIYLVGLYNAIRILIPADVINSNYIVSDLDVRVIDDFNAWAAIKIYEN